MNNAVHITENEQTNMAFFDAHDIGFKRVGENDMEIIIYPSLKGNVHIRFAREPYGCQIHLANGDTRIISLNDESDWGNVRHMNPTDWFKEGKGAKPNDWYDRIGWGNDEDGHIEIVKVERYGVDIPLKDFKQDIEDLLSNYSY